MDALYILFCALCDSFVLILIVTGAGTKTRYSIFVHLTNKRISWCVTYVSHLSVPHFNKQD